ncbi:MAG TPA: GNAT family N-acetyltransferase [Sphingomonas sp.]|uniref:GNAT family N-acetyltransferase n=1 Tax=Sphingomonas sp. TaxID=28214 RepID=UPI002ED91E54
MTAIIDDPIEIRTPRLRLRPHVAEDLAARWALGMMPEFYRYTSGQAATEEDSWHRVLRYIGHWTSFGYGFFAVLDATTGRFLGEAGAMDFRRGIGDGFGRRPEMGWGFHPDVHGTGVAGEAIRAVLAWMDAGAGQAGTVCMINPENVASVRLAERLGYRPTGEAVYHDRPVSTFARAAGATFVAAPG